MMNKTFVIFLALLVAVAAQDATVTAGLLEAQEELSIGHEFFESTLILNRGEISDYMSTIGSQLVTSHIDAYGQMKIRILDTNEVLDAFEINLRNEECFISVRSRWNLQVTRSKG